jgi:hypothetical protein
MIEFLMDLPHQIIEYRPVYHPNPLLKSHTPGLVKLSDNHLHKTLYIHILHALLGTTGKPQGNIRVEVLGTLATWGWAPHPGFKRPVGPALCRQQCHPRDIMPFMPFADIRKDLRRVAGILSLTPRDSFLKRGRTSQPTFIAHFTLRYPQVTLEEAQGCTEVSPFLEDLSRRVDIVDEEMEFSGYLVPSPAVRDKNVAMAPYFVGDASWMQHEAWLPVFVCEYGVLSVLYAWLRVFFPRLERTNSCYKLVMRLYCMFG